MSKQGLDKFTFGLGVPPATVLQWLDAGVLAASYDGGNPTFDVSGVWHGERLWSLLAKALYGLRVPLEDIRVIVGGFREQIADLTFPDAAPEVQQRGLRAHPIGRALMGERRIIAVAVESAKVEIAVDPVKRLAFTTIAAGPAPSADDDLEEPMPANVDLEYMAMFPVSWLLDVTAIFRPLAIDDTPAR